MNENNALSFSQKCVDLVKEFEGCKLSSYKCPAGVWTIGYGSTAGVHGNMTIDQQEAEDRLHADLCNAEEDVLALVDVVLTQGQLDALVSFVFNLGAAKFKKSTLLKKLNAKDFSGAASEFEKWVYSGKVVLSGLVRRREAEKSLFMG